MRGWTPAQRGRGREWWAPACSTLVASRQESPVLASLPVASYALGGEREGNRVRGQAVPIGDGELPGDNPPEDRRLKDTRDGAERRGDRRPRS